MRVYTSSLTQRSQKPLISFLFHYLTSSSQSLPVCLYVLSKTPSESTVSQGGWGYWGSWGKSILSTATATVATVGECRAPTCILHTGYTEYSSLQRLSSNLSPASCVLRPSRPRPHAGHREGRDVAGNPQSDRAVGTSGRGAERPRCSS